MEKSSGDTARKRGQARRTRSKRAGGRRQPNAAKEWLKSIVVALVLFVVLRAFVVQTFVITSGYMEKTLLVGDFLVVNRAAIGSAVPFTHVRIPGYSSPRRGDVLVFLPPPSDPINMDLVKRLVGMPGDTIEMRNRVVYIDGKALHEPYVVHTDAPDFPDSTMAWQRRYLAPSVDPVSYRPTRDNWGPLVIPTDHYFMMGDNRENSLDSRFWGFVEGGNFQGRVELLYFSYDKQSYRPFPWIRDIRWRRIGKGIH